MGRRRKITREKVIDAIASIAFDDIGNYLSYTTDAEGKTTLQVRDSSCVDTRNIQEVSVGRDGRLTFKLYSRHEGASAGKFLLQFSLWNFAFLAVLLAICMVF